MRGRLFPYPPLEGEGRFASRERCEAGWGDTLSSSVVLQRHGFRFASVVELDINPLQHSAEVSRDFRVPEPDDAEALFFEPLLSLAIAHCRFIVVVMPAVEFDDQPLGRTEEVDDIGANRSLLSEMRAFRRQFLQRTP